MCNANLQSACTSTSSISYIVAFYFGFFNFSGFFQDPPTAVKSKCAPPFSLPPVIKTLLKNNLHCSKKTGKTCQWEQILPVFKLVWV